MQTNIRRFFTPDHVCVLTLTVSLPENLDSAQTEFYKPLCEQFELAVENRLFPLAIEAYNQCTDRRKRWRYNAWQAEFCLTREGDAIILSLCSCNTVHLKQAHTWKSGVIIHRKKLV